MIAIVYGTRPEFLKLFPLIHLCREQNVQAIVINTGQHDKLLSKMEEQFKIVPDVNLSVQSIHLSNSRLLAKLINDLSVVFQENNITKVIAQGDTFTVLASSMVSFVEKIKFYHIEAGLRTSNINLPFPEEYNRRVISLGTAKHFAPTQRAVDNLLKESIPEDQIVLSGNTIVDMIDYVLDRENITIKYDDIVFITAHRRENIGRPLENIGEAIKELAIENPKIKFIWSLHPNPNTRKIISEVFKSVPENIEFKEPMEYLETVEIMAKTKLIITDSGGIQEEAPSLHKKVIILRTETERPEVLECNCGVLTGTDKENIKQIYYTLINGNYKFENMKNPFGDGRASEYILKEVLKD